MRSTLLLLLLLPAFRSFSQCRAPLPLPACSGTEPLVVGGDVISPSQTKYFYGADATLSNVRLDGGTLVVCGNLTLDNLTFDSGKIFVRPSATAVVTNGAGLVLRGGSSIYNFGVFQCLGNIVLDGTYATAARPNVVFNALGAWFKNANQYFVLNNPNSWFVNQGLAEFHGIITDYTSAPGSVCLGYLSTTRMMVLYNKVKNTYVAPSGPACVYVTNFSQFYDSLTAHPAVNVCLGPLHSSDGSCVPWGCKPNAWGRATVKTNCTVCSPSTAVLPLTAGNIVARVFDAYNLVEGEVVPGTGGAMFYLERSTDGHRFEAIDSLAYTSASGYRFLDYRIRAGKVYYRVVYRSVFTAESRVSNTVSVERPGKSAAVFPNPFDEEVTVSLSSEARASVVVSDVVGRELPSFSFVQRKASLVVRLGSQPSGIYFVRVVQNGAVAVYRVCKK